MAAASPSARCHADFLISVNGNSFYSISPKALVSPLVFIFLLYPTSNPYANSVSHMFKIKSELTTFYHVCYNLPGPSVTTIFLLHYCDQLHLLSLFLPLPPPIFLIASSDAFFLLPSPLLSPFPFPEVKYTLIGLNTN